VQHHASFVVSYRGGCGYFLHQCTKAGTKSKTSALSLIKLPRAETALFDRWLKIYRPVLVDPKSVRAISPAVVAMTGMQGDPGFLFLTQHGKARTEISYAISKLMAEYIPTRATAHAFRHMQANALSHVLSVH
jgi:hypothetical protein